MALKTVTQFLENLKNSGGPSSTNQFDLEFSNVSVPLKLHVGKFGVDAGHNPSFNGLMVDMINEAQIPGVSLTSQDVKQVHKGVNIKAAMAKVYNEMDFSCILDVHSEAFKFFTAWQDFIQGGNRVKVAPTAPSGKPYTRGIAMNYYSDYTCDLKIKKFEKFAGSAITGELNDKTEQFHVFTVNLVKAYPYMLSSIPYSSAGSGVVKLSVGMYYEYSEFTPFEYPQKTKLPGTEVKK